MTPRHSENVVQLNSTPLFDRRDLVPDGVYVVALKDYRTGRHFNRGTLQAAFVIIEGNHANTVLTKYYTVSLGKDKPRRHGAFKASAGSLLVSDFGSCFGRPSRLDRIAFTKFEDTPVLATTRTVKKDQRQKDTLPEHMWWSTIERLRPQI